MAMWVCFLLVVWTAESFPFVSPLATSTKSEERRIHASIPHQYSETLLNRVLVDEQRQSIDVPKQIEQIVHENEPTILATSKSDGKKAKATLADLLVLGGAVANVVTFKMFGFYASMMTGNTMRFCMSLVDLRL